MYPLDQVTESLIVNCFEEGSAANKFAYEQFFTTLEQTVEELAKCFLLEFGENKELSYGRCRQEMSFNDLYDGLKNIDCQQISPSHYEQHLPPPYFEYGGGKFMVLIIAQ